MNNLFITAFLLMLVLTACKHRDKKVSHISKEINTELTENNFSDPCVYKTLDGTIAGKPVIMHFLKYNDNININYYYVEKGQPIFLSKDWGKTNNDSIYLLEDIADSSGLSAKLSLIIADDALKGTWESADGKKFYPVDLKESSEQPTLHFAAFGFSDSAKYLKFKTDTPMLKSSVAMIASVDKSDGAKWLNKILKNTLDNVDNINPSATLQQMSKEMVENDVAGYQADIDSSLMGETIDDTVGGGHYLLNREYVTIGNIVYNANGYVVCSVYGYSYTGGVHGNYGTAMACYDVTGKKELTLKDIVNIDSTTISSLLDKSYREKYFVSSTTLISEKLFVPHIPANTNFYFSPAGLGFVYTPYEIASYADGEINLWIPFSKLKPYLNPEFAKRMKL